MKRIFEVSPWTITTHELNPADKRLQESITSLGNEYMGMRGMFEETYTGDSLQGVYIGLVPRQDPCWLVEEWVPRVLR